MGRKRIKYKKAKYIKILDKASGVVGAVALTLGTVRKIINNENKSK